MLNQLSLHDNDASLCGGITVDIIDPRPSPPDNFQICCCFNHISSHLRGWSNYQPIIFLEIWTKFNSLYRWIQNNVWLDWPTDMSERLWEGLTGFFLIFWQKHRAVKQPYDFLTRFLKVLFMGGSISILT